MNQPFHVPSRFQKYFRIFRKKYSTARRMTSNDSPPYVLQCAEGSPPNSKQLSAPFCTMAHDLRRSGPLSCSTVAAQPCDPVHSPSVPGTVGLHPGGIQRRCSVGQCLVAASKFPKVPKVPKFRTRCRCLCSRAGSMWCSATLGTVPGAIAGDARWKSRNESRLLHRGRASLRDLHQSSFLIGSSIIPSFHCCLFLFLIHIHIRTRHVHHISSYHIRHHHCQHQRH